MASHADMDDDDIYPENDDYVPQESTMQDMDDEEEGEEVESDSDDDINFITDTKDEPKAEVGSQSLRPGSRVNEKEKSRPSPAPTPGIKRELTPQANINRISTPQSDGRPGTDYPARHTSALDPLNGNPVHPTTSKPILDTDLDADFPSESSKPWRKPGADITDYFNYGFDEFTWASYCLKKQQIPKEIKAINQETEHLKAFMDQMPGGGMAGMPAIPSAASATGQNPAEMSGMPSQADMQQMFDYFKMQGIDPMSMDPAQMASMMMMGGGPNPIQPGNQPPTGPAGFSGGHQDNFGGGRGRGRRGRGNWQ